LRFTTTKPTLCALYSYTAFAVTAGYEHNAQT
jgi:hypothetical protein